MTQNSHMKDTPLNKTPITLPLDILLQEILKDNHYIEVTQHTAEMLFVATRNKHSVHVQFPTDKDTDILGRPLFKPIVWHFARWAESTERWQKAKARSEVERKERFIRDHNINTVTRYLVRTYEQDEVRMRWLASKWIDNHQEKKAIRAGCRPFIKTIEEI